MSAPPVVPVVDWQLLLGDRARFLAELRHALADVGYVMLANVPGFDNDVQQRTFQAVRRFFDGPLEVKATASIDRTAHFRGWYPPVQNASQLIETFTYGMEEQPIAAHDDESVPQWKRIFHGQNTWPGDGLVPGFRSAVEALRSAYLELHHVLGRLICESLGADPARYDELFDPEDLRLAAFLGHGYSLSHIERGGIATNHRVVSGVEGRRQVAVELQKKMSHGTHVDITPFVTLITMDTPGLQVLSTDDEWVDMPVLPGCVCVQVGSALQHLSGGRMLATMHRVNTTLIPDGKTRVSLPFFLLPEFGVDLVPFDTDTSGPGGGTNYATEDHGMIAAYNRMSLFPSCTRLWWAAEAKRIQEQAQRAQLKELRATVAMLREKGKRSAL